MLISTNTNSSQNRNTKKISTQIQMDFVVLGCCLTIPLVPLTIHQRVQTKAIIALPSPATSSCLWSRFTLECWTSHFKEKFIEVLSNCISNNLFKVSSDFYSGVSCSTWCGLVYLVGQVTGGVKRWPTINKVEMLQLRQPLVPPPCLPVINLAI